MKKDLKVKKMLAALLTLAMLCALSTTALAKVDIPEKAAQATGTTVYQNEKASVDASNLTEGYLIVRYTDDGIDLTGNARLIYEGEVEY